MTRDLTAIVGAGAAGLAAARELRAHGREVVVLEARRRIGGRIFTRRPRESPLPVELGAEFVHGEAPETLGIVREAGLLAAWIAPDAWIARRGHVRREPLDRPVDRVLARIDAGREDESFAEFLERRPGGAPLARDRRAAAEFVQGFHAADLDAIGTHGIAPEDGERPSEPATNLTRILSGNDRLCGWLARGLGPRLRLGAAVTGIRWRRGHVELAVRAGRGTRTLSARRAIVTVPAGVLQAPPGDPGAIEILPEPPALRTALESVAMGSVTKLAVLFDELPWLLRRDPPREAIEKLSLLRTPESAFNVWWPATPARAPLAVAWSGGPPGAGLANRSRAENVEFAVRELARALGLAPARLRARVRGVWAHDWEHDPFSRGAYSFVRVGGEGVAAKLARLVDGTLAFAGEATDPEASSTVEGALASGRRAARAILRAGAARGR